MKLKIENLCKKYDKKEILKNINIELNSGEILALIGRNGSGKTTLLQTLVGMIERNSGDIFLDDKNIQNNPKLLQEIVYIPDKFDYFKYTKISKVIDYYKLIYPKFDETYFLNNLAKNNIEVTKRFSKLSKGETAIVAVALGLSCNTKFIFLDEPLDGIDVININQVLECLLDAQERGVGVIVSSHQLNHLEKISNKIYYLGKENFLDKSGDIDSENYKKYQVVYGEIATPQLFEEDNVKVISSIGRVHTIIVKDDGAFEEKLQKTNPIQYDKMNATLEEIFILENNEGA